MVDPLCDAYIRRVTENGEHNPNVDYVSYFATYLHNTDRFVLPAAGEEDTLGQVGSF